MTRGHVYGMTMSQITRARSTEAKRQRAETLLRAARELEAEHGFTAMTMAAVAERAGLAKGTLFLYFPTKEALGLALLDDLLDGWFSELVAGLAPERIGGDPRRVARLIAASLARRPSLTRMLAIQGAVLERNVDGESIRTFKAGLLARLRETGAALERALPFLVRGDGLQFQLFLHVLVAGLHPMAEPAEGVREALGGAELAALRLDFAGSLESALRVHLEGLRALRRTAG